MTKRVDRRLLNSLWSRRFGNDPPQAGTTYVRLPSPSITPPREPTITRRGCADRGCTRKTTWPARAFNHAATCVRAGRRRPRASREMGNFISRQHGICATALSCCCCCWCCCSYRRRRRGAGSTCPPKVRENNFRTNIMKKSSIFRAKIM